MLTGVVAITLLSVSLSLRGETAQPSGGKSNLVSTFRERTELLERAERILRIDNTEIKEEIKSVGNPFETPAEPVSEQEDHEEIKEEKKEVATEPEILTLTDHNILEITDQRIKPRGIMVKGNEEFLQVEEGFLQIGDEITVTVRDQAYIVKVGNITNKTYTLIRNEAELNRSFYEENILDQRKEENSPTP